MNSAQNTGRNKNDVRTPDVVQRLLRAAHELRTACDTQTFAEPVTHVYNPLNYAWAPHEQYLRRFASGSRRVVWLGMNPGPFGMMQTGVPFGEVAAVRDWMGIVGDVQRPRKEHPKRTIEGFACARSEVSGRRVWSWAAERFGSADTFFAENFVLNYCPLVFLEASGRNFTPDKLPAREARALEAVCDAHLAACLRALSPKWVVGIGAFAKKRLLTVIAGDKTLAAAGIQIAQVIHPSPASPIANRGWAAAVEAALLEQGVFAAFPLDSKPSVSSA